MDQIQQQVSRARRRLTLELFVNRLLRCWLVGFCLALIAITVPKLIAIENLPDRWGAGCLLAALAAGPLVAAAWTFLKSRTPLEAAQEIDHRYDLRERVASSLALSSDDAETPAGRALVNDALRAVGRIDVDERFRMRVDRRGWWPLVPAALAFCLILLVDNRRAESSPEPAPDALTKEQLENSTKDLREKLLKQKKKAAEKGLKDAEELFQKLERQTKQLGEAEEAGRKKALIKLNDLAKQLEKRQANLGGQEALRKQLSKVKNVGKGPADKMMKAMKNGQWQTAMQELKKLQQQIKEGNLSPEAQQKLQKQLEALKEQLSKAAEAQKQAAEDLKKQIEQAKQQGDTAKAGELKQKLDQLQQQQQSNPLDKLAQQMSECQQCMSQGDASGASDAMSEMMKSMEQMQAQSAEMEMLDSAMDQLQMARDSMCEGQCEGEGMGMGKLSNRMGRGQGMGQGRGGGSRSDEENDVRFRNSRVRQKPGRGAAVFAGEADGPNMRGQVAEAIKEELAAENSTDADPLVIEQLPKSRRAHAEEFFNSIREGE
ncbi:MAG: hypothetical protein AAGA92_00165 [Planctomycetota bacterium]